MEEGEEDRRQEAGGQETGVKRKGVSCGARATKELRSTDLLRGSDRIRRGSVTCQSIVTPVACQTWHHVSWGGRSLMPLPADRQLSAQLSVINLVTLARVSIAHLLLLVFLPLVVL